MSILKPKKSKKGIIAAAAIGSAVAAGAALLTTKKGKALLSDVSKKAGKVSSGVSSLLHADEKKVKRTIRKSTPRLKKAVKVVKKRVSR